MKLSVSAVHKKWWQFLRQDASSLFAALIQATRSSEACSHLISLLAVTCSISVTPNCSCVLCLLKGVSSSATHFPSVHLMRCAPRLGWGKREVFICTTNFHPRFYKIFKSFLSWTWNLLPLIVEMFPLNVYSFSFLGNKLSHCSVSARVTTGPSAFYANQEGSRVSLTLRGSAEDLAFGNGRRDCHLFRQYMLVASLITRFLWQLSRLNQWAFDL